MEYRNVTRAIGTAIGTGFVTWSELDAIGVEDLWDIMEVSAVDAHNALILQERAKHADDH